MALASILTRARQGMDAPQVHVEVHLSNGLPAFNLVGLPETSVREAKERVRSAIINAGFEFPMRRITVLCKINRNKGSIYYVLSFSNLPCLSVEYAKIF